MGLLTLVHKHVTSLDFRVQTLSHTRDQESQTIILWIIIIHEL